MDRAQLINRLQALHEFKKRLEQERDWCAQAVRCGTVLTIVDEKLADIRRQRKEILEAIRNSKR